MTEYEDPQLTFNVALSRQEDQSHFCVVTVSTLDDSATRKCSFISLISDMVSQLSACNVGLKLGASSVDCMKADLKIHSIVA